MSMIEFVQEEIQSTGFSDSVVIGDDGIPVAPEVLEQTEEELAMSEEQALESFLEASHDYQIACEGIERINSILSNLETMRDKVSQDKDFGIESMEYLMLGIETQLSAFGDTARFIAPSLENLQEMKGNPEIAIEGLDYAIEGILDTAFAAVGKTVRKFTDFILRGKTMAKLTRTNAEQNSLKIKKLSANSVEGTVTVGGIDNLIFNGSVSPSSILAGLKATNSVGEKVFGEYLTNSRKFLGALFPIAWRHFFDLTGSKFDTWKTTTEVRNSILKELDESLGSAYKGIESLKFSGDRYFMAKDANSKYTWSKMPKATKKSGVNSTQKIDVPTKSELMAINQEVISLAGKMVDRYSKFSNFVKAIETYISGIKEYNGKVKKRIAELKDNRSAAQAIGNMIISLAINLSPAAGIYSTLEGYRNIIIYGSMISGINSFSKASFSTMRAANTLIDKSIAAYRD